MRAVAEPGNPRTEDLSRPGVIKWWNRLVFLLMLACLAGFGFVQYTLLTNRGHGGAVVFLGYLSLAALTMGFPEYLAWKTCGIYTAESPVYCLAAASMIILFLGQWEAFRRGGRMAFSKWGWPGLSAAILVFVTWCVFWGGKLFADLVSIDPA